MSSALRFAHRLDHVAPSAIREILKVAERPDVLSFAGGLPAPELFPAAALAEASGQVLAEAPGPALQYGVTEGFGPLRGWIAARYARGGVPTNPEQILVIHGSQQGIDLVARAFLNPGDRVLVEEPTYLAALQAFGACEAEPVAVASDDDGLRPEALASALRDTRPALLYVVPTFGNPTGRTLSEARRHALVALAAAHGVPVLADEPYAELRFAGSALTPLAALDGDLVIQLGTFSKTLAPGLRVGWVRAPEAIRSRLTVLKQSQDLHTSTFAQRLIVKLLERFDFDAHLAELRRVYAARAAAMQAALASALPAGAEWTRPEGGLFVWVTLPEGVSEDAVFQAALARKVAVVPGAPFFVRRPARGHLRLSFSNRGEDLIRRGMAVLGEAIREVAAQPVATRAGGAQRSLT